MIQIVIDCKEYDLGGREGCGEHDDITMPSQ